MCSLSLSFTCLPAWNGSTWRRPIQCSAQAAYAENVGWETVGIGVGWAPKSPRADLWSNIRTDTEVSIRGACCRVAPPFLACAPRRSAWDESSIVTALPHVTMLLAVTSRRSREGAVGSSRSRSEKVLPNGRRAKKRKKNLKNKKMEKMEKQK